MLSLSLSSKNDHDGGGSARLLQGFPQILTFERENEEEGAPLQTLPEELLILILRMLDPTSIERFAAVSRKAFTLSLDNTIWRYAVPSSHSLSVRDGSFIQRNSCDDLHSPANTGHGFPYRACQPLQVQLSTTVYRDPPHQNRRRIHCILSLYVRAIRLPTISTCR
jgi:hypothetical protein